MDDHFYQHYPSHRIHSQQVTDSGNKKVVRNIANGHLLFIGVNLIPSP